MSTLTITSEPIDWRGAVRVAVQEVRRLQRYGVTQGELERYKSALLRDSEQLAEGAGSVPSHDNLEFVMESLALGHTVLEQRAVRRGGWEGAGWGALERGWGVLGGGGA